VRKMKSKIEFQTRMVSGHVLEVWLGTPDDSESEFVLGIDIALVPALIRTLSLHVPYPKPNPRKRDK